jgi:Ca-activated chloride channel family protein
MSLSFERPFLIGAGLVLLPVILFMSRFFRSIFILTVPLGPPGGIPFKAPLNIEFLVKIIHVLEFLGVLLLWAAAAGPRFLSAETVWLNRGADILFVVDVSPSMAGLDMDGHSRFDAAGSLVRDFAARRPSDALGLVAVGDDAALLVPPTVDRASLISRLDSLKIGELGDGTALGLGISIAALHLRNSQAPRKAVVLITDGENNAGSVHPETAAGLLPGLGVSLWIIGVGSRGEVPIDYVDPQTRIRRTGTFDSRFDPESLKAVARKGEGTYISAPQGEALERAFSRLNEAEMTIRRSGTVTRTRPFHGPLIVAAMVLLWAVRIIRRYVLGAWL